MDLPGPTFRHLRDASYKATRFEGLKAQVVSSLTDVEGLNETALRDVAEAVVSAGSREQIKTAVMAVAGEVGLPEEAKLGLERAIGPVENAWEIGRQIQRCLEMMEAFNIPVYSMPGFEADDVMGTLSVQAAEQGIDTYLVTLDSDLVQLIRPDVTVYMLRPYQRDKVIYTEETAREHYGFEPELMKD